MKIGYYSSTNSRNFARTDPPARIPFFHFHITLFKQILKPELREIPDTCWMPVSFAEISRQFVEHLRSLEWKNSGRVGCWVNNHPSNSSRICRNKHPRQWSRLQGWSYRNLQPARSSFRNRELANALPVHVSSGNGAGVSKEEITFLASCFWRFVIQIQHSIEHLYFCAQHFMQASSDYIS